MKKINISVIIPFYNEINLINNAVHSVLNQNLSSPVFFEIIIVNDGDIYTNKSIIDQLSTSNTYNCKITVVSNTFGSGPGGARNQGLEICIGDYISFLDSDDVWLPNKIELQLKLAQSGYNFICSDYYFGNFSDIVHAPTCIDSPLSIFNNLGIGTSSVFIESTLIRDIRFRDLRFSQDIDFWYRLSKLSSFSFASINKPLVLYYVGGSTKNKFVQFISLYKVLSINNINFHRSFCILFNYSFRGIYNHYIKRLFKFSYRNKV